MDLGPKRALARPARAFLLQGLAVQPSIAAHWPSCVCRAASRASWDVLPRRGLPQLLLAPPPQRAMKHLASLAALALALLAHVSHRHRRRRAPPAPAPHGSLDPPKPSPCRPLPRTASTCAPRASPTPSWMPGAPRTRLVLPAHGCRRSPAAATAPSLTGLLVCARTARSRPRTSPMGSTPATAASAAAAAAGRPRALPPPLAGSNTAT